MGRDWGMEDRHRREQITWVRVLTWTLSGRRIHGNTLNREMRLFGSFLKVLDVFDRIHREWVSSAMPGTELTRPFAKMHGQPLLSDCS